MRKFSKTKRLLKPILLGVFLYTIYYILYTSAALAQFQLPTNQLPNLNLKPTLSLTSDPLTPQPNLIITVIANLSGITNVNNSDYAWFLNGVKQKEASVLIKIFLLFRLVIWALFIKLALAF